MMDNTDPDIDVYGPDSAEATITLDVRLFWAILQLASNEADDTIQFYGDRSRFDAMNVLHTAILRQKGVYSPSIMLHQAKEVVKLRDEAQEAKTGEVPIWHDWREKNGQT